MSNPKLKKVRIEIGYWSSDEYESSEIFNSELAKQSPELTMANAIDEMARIMALFDLPESIAQSAVSGAYRRVREYRENRIGKKP